MGDQKLVPTSFRDGDWAALRRVIAKLAFSKLGPSASPVFKGLDVQGTLDADALNVSGAVTLSGSLILDFLDASRLTATNASKGLESTDLASWVTGTANQVTVADDADGTITLSAPQDIHTGATPTFAGMTLSGFTGILWSNAGVVTGDATLDLVGDPAADHTFTMANKTLTWTFVNPAGGMLFNWTGAATGHSFELRQSGGNPGTDMHMLHIESSDADPCHIHSSHAATTSRVLMVHNDTILSEAAARFVLRSDGQITWGDGTNAVDTNLYRTAANQLKTDDAFLADDLTLANPSNVYSLSHDSFADFALDEHVAHSGVTLTAGTGLSGGGDISANRTFNLSHLGIENLSDPGADRLMFWDDSETKVDWLTVGTGLSISGTTITATSSGGVVSFVNVVNILLTAWRGIRWNTKSYQYLMDGGVDALIDQTGIDTGASSGGTYNSSEDRYESGSSDSVDQEQTSADGLLYIGDAGSGDQKVGQSFQVSAGGITCSKADLYFGTTNGSPTGNVTVRIETNSGGNPSGTLVDANATVAISITDDSWNEAVFPDTFSLSAGTTYWLVAQAAAQSGGNYWEWDSNSSGGYASGEAKLEKGSGWTSTSRDMKFRIYKSIPADMTVISNAYPAEAAPSDIRLLVLEEDVDAVTVNTDLLGYVSRDGGTTWTQVTFADEGDYESGKRLLSGTVDVSGQPSGTSIRWKTVGQNNKEFYIYGMAMSWE